MSTIASITSASEPRSVGPLPLTADQLLRSQETTLARLVTTGAIADSRSGLVISSNIGMLGALVASISGTTLGSAGATLWLLLGLTTAICVASIAMAALAALPRPGTRPGSLVFFGSIAEMSRDDYFERLRTVAQVDFARDLAEQCHRVAVLAALKFRWVRRAMATMMAAAVPWLACLEMLGRLRLP
ncbi:MAG TPA: Pycsar system effector family protein [Burkholderiaceae bacterium]|nr:Pycsar system effector family protein [Burkholderiaceae bacterium]